MRARFLKLLLLSLLAATACSGVGQASTKTDASASRGGAGARVPAGVNGPGRGTASLVPLLVDDAHAANPELVPVQVVGFPQHTLQLPRGFSVSVLASGLSQPRFMAFDPGGNLLVGSDDGAVYRLATDSAQQTQLLTGLRAPSSVAFSGGYLYVAETTGVRRYLYRGDGPVGPAETVVPDLPSGGHFTRTVVFDPDGQMYLSVGSSCNICDERDERRAAILATTLMAAGIRNSLRACAMPSGSRCNRAQGSFGPPSTNATIRGTRFLRTSSLLYSREITSAGRSASRRMPCLRLRVRIAAGLRPPALGSRLTPRRSASPSTAGDSSPPTTRGICSSCSTVPGTANLPRLHSFSASTSRAASQ